MNEENYAIKVLKREEEECDNIAFDLRQTDPPSYREFTYEKQAKQLNQAIKTLQGKGRADLELITEQQSDYLVQKFKEWNRHHASNDKYRIYAERIK